MVKHFLTVMRRGGCAIIQVSDEKETDEIVKADIDQHLR